MNIKKLLILNLPYLLFVYPFDKLSQAVRLAPGADLSAKILSIGEGFTAAFSSLGLSLDPVDLLVGIAGAVILRVAVHMKGKNAKKYRHGMEYGSARWGTAADIAPYMDKDFFQNIPMTMTERITMSSRPKQPKYARNKNILVIGGSGSGKQGSSASLHFSRAIPRMCVLIRKEYSCRRSGPSWSGRNTVSSAST